MSVLGPNTNAAPDLLQAKCIICCGEDASHLTPLLPATVQMYHESRNYRFWRLPGVTLVLSGMGTGCVEPLIWELTRPGVVREMVLIGTAGKMQGVAAAVGVPHAITEAYLAGTGLDGENLTQPLRPRWNAISGNLPKASSVSTDFFYGFAPRVLNGGYPLANGRLRELYEKYSKAVELIDMEVAQFYAFCELFGDPGLKYLAIKGATNELEADEEQIERTAGVIEECWSAAMKLLGI